MPRISVVIPTFNRLEYLSEAIASVRAQTYRDWELLIADDGSDEETLIFLDRIRDDAQVRVLQLPHSGRPAAVRNAALRCAQGEYVAFLDSDDLWAPHKLETQLGDLLQRPECRWSYSAFCNVDAHGNTLASEAQRRFTPCEGAVFDRMLRAEVSLRTPAVLAARSLIESAGGFDASLPSAEDYDLWLRLALQSPIAFTPEILVWIRHHDQHHSGAWSQAYEAQDRTFRKLRGIAPDVHRPFLRQARTRNALRLAEEHAHRGERAHAIAALCSSATYSLDRAEWWWRSLKVAARTLAPASVQRLPARWRQPS